MKHINVMIKPASGNCNMRCTYCFYTDVSHMRQVKSYGMMGDEVLEQVVRQVIGHAEDSCSFVFQGGEPTLAGLDFYRRLIRYQEKYNEQGIKIQNAIQTNGLILDETWTEFLGENHFLVGLSVDGTKEVHDFLRKDAEGKPTYQRILRVARVLEKYHVSYNILTVVTRQMARHTAQIYRQYRRNGWQYMQFIPCLDAYEAERGSSPYSLTPSLYAHFLKDLFDLWYADLERGEWVYIRYFDNLMGILLGIPPESCGLMGSCRAQIVIEADGSVYPCDFYVLDSYRMGKLTEDSWETLLSSRNALRFESESQQPADRCRTCSWVNLCRGGCRRDRDSHGSVGINYYCTSYQEFFEYVGQRLWRAATLYSSTQNH